jgi:hypothetical protein
MTIGGLLETNKALISTLPAQLVPSLLEYGHSLVKIEFGLRGTKRVSKNLLCIRRFRICGFTSFTPSPPPKVNMSTTVSSFYP